jgi:hypothetical protein
MAYFVVLYRVKANGTQDATAVNIATPSYGSATQTASTLVDSGRTADGVVIGTRVGRDLVKLELSWAYLTAAQWKTILGVFTDNTSIGGGAGFYAYATYYDMVLSAATTRLFYVGDRTATPFSVNPSTMAVTAWRDCSLSLIDTGKGA